MYQPSKEEIRQEITRLRRKAEAIYPEMKQLKDQLKPLESRWVDLTYRRLKLEEEITNITVLPLAGTNKRSQAKGSSDAAKATKMAQALSPDDRRALLAALTGEAEPHDDEAEPHKEVAK